MTMYYIRSKSNPGEMLRGTPSYHRFVKSDGRLFPSIGKLRAFISAVLKNEYRRKGIPDWEVIEAELITKDVKQVHEIIKADKLIELLKV